MSIAEHILLDKSAEHMQSLELQTNEAGELPSWVSLQHEIRDRLIQLKKLTELGITGGLDDSLEDLNRKVEKYNELISSPGLQKAKLTQDTFLSLMDQWK